MKRFLQILIVLSLTACNVINKQKEVKLIPYSQKNKYGYFDREGKIAITPQFAFASAFRDGIALVKSDGDNPKWGYISEDGKYIINAKYTDATIFNEGLAWVVTENSAPMAIDKKGNTKFTLKDAENVQTFHEGLAAYSIADSSNIIWGFVDKNGARIINPQFKEVRQYSEGKCAVKNKDDKWGYIDKEGKIIINYQFDNAADFTDSKAAVYLDDKAGIIDDEGHYIVNPQFQYVEIDEDKYKVWQDNKVGWCDKDAKFIINPQFEEASNFCSDELAAVKSSDKYGFIDEDGKIIINPQFEEAFPFMDNLALVKSGDKYGLINKEGKYVVNPQFESIGLDLLFYLRTKEGSLKNSITSEFVDVNTILDIIKLKLPENISFSDNFQKIANKFNKKSSDFTSSYTNVLLEEKVINKDAKYAFGVLGNAIAYDYNYNSILSTETPEGFIYGITLSGRAAGKAEEFQKAFEKKLNGYTLLKKGYIENTYTSVFKSNDGFVICSNSNLNMPLFYIMNKKFDPTTYLGRISEKASIEQESTYIEEPAVEEEYTEEYADTVATGY